MRNEFDVIVVGGGLVGLSLAGALARDGLAVALLESQSPPPAADDGEWDNRVYSVSPGCALFLDRCGAWGRLPDTRVARIEKMRVYGDDPAACLEFDAYESGLRELAFVAENRRLQRALWDAVSEGGVRVFSPAAWTALELGREQVAIRLEDGGELHGRLVVGADGAESRVRKQADIRVTGERYRQTGVVANFACARAHHGTAYQWFRRDGILALLPLPGDRVSMVWSADEILGRELLALPPAALAEAVQSASHGKLGSLEPIGPAAGFPLRLQRVTQITKARLALVGDAAHNVHPLAGQGVNLGFRDARELADVLRNRGPQRDCGDALLLRRFERARREDIVAMQWATDGLQKLFGSEAVSLARARNFGLGLVNRQSMLKRFLVHHAAT